MATFVNQSLDVTFLSLERIVLVAWLIPFLLSDFGPAATATRFTIPLFLQILVCGKARRRPLFLTCCKKISPYTKARGAQDTDVLPNIPPQLEHYDPHSRTHCLLHCTPLKRTKPFSLSHQSGQTVFFVFETFDLFDIQYSKLPERLFIHTGFIFFSLDFWRKIQTHFAHSIICFFFGSISLFLV